MSAQLAIDFTAPPVAAAVRMGEIGMQRAAERAEREVPGFVQNAFAFLEACVALRDQPFSAEEIVELGRDLGLNPPDGRAWGPVFQRAASVGMIRRSSQTYRRAKGNGTLGVKWERVR